ncbi:MAG TPA: IucA/IucC family C-terminal-domain containing protein [Micromonospora sp.]
MSHAVAQSLAPEGWRTDAPAVAAALREAGRFGRYAQVDLDGRHGPPATRLYRDPAALATAIGRVAVRLGCHEWRVAASMLHVEYTLRLWSIVLGAVTAARIVPDLTGLRCRYGLDGRAQPALTGVGGWRLVDERGGCALVARTVLDGHVRPLQAALRRTARLPERLLWGNTAAMLLSAVRTVGGAQPPAGLRRLAVRLLAAPPLRDAIDHRLGPDGWIAPGSVVRRSCCLSYRLADPHICAECPVGGTAWHRGDGRSGCHRDPG